MPTVRMPCLKHRCDQSGRIEGGGFAALLAYMSGSFLVSPCLQVRGGTGGRTFRHRLPPDGVCHGECRACRTDVRASCSRSCRFSVRQQGNIPNSTAADAAGTFVPNAVGSSGRKGHYALRKCRIRRDTTVRFLPTLPGSRARTPCLPDGFRVPACSNNGSGCLPAAPAMILFPRLCRCALRRCRFRRPRPGAMSRSQSRWL